MENKNMTELEFALIIYSMFKAGFDEHKLKRFMPDSKDSTVFRVLAEAKKHIDREIMGLTFAMMEEDLEKKRLEMEKIRNEK